MVQEQPLCWLNRQTSKVALRGNPIFSFKSRDETWPGPLTLPNIIWNISECYKWPPDGQFGVISDHFCTSTQCSSTTQWFIVFSPSSEQDMWSVEKTSCPTKHLSCSHCTTPWQGVTVCGSAKGHGGCRRSEAGSLDCKLASTVYPDSSSRIPFVANPLSLSQIGECLWGFNYSEKDAAGSVCLEKHWLT